MIRFREVKFHLMLVKTRKYSQRAQRSGVQSVPLVAKKLQETDEKNCIAFIGDVFTEDTNIQFF